MTERTFCPAWGKGKQVAPTTTTARSLIEGRNKVIVVTNYGTETCYFRTGDSSVVATSADYMILAGTQLSVTKFRDDDNFAYLSAAGTGALHVIPGDGF